MDFFLIHRHSAADPYWYDKLSETIKTYDGRILNNAQAGKLCRQLQEQVNKDIDDLNETRKRTFGRFNDDHPRIGRPKVELRPRDNRLDLTVEGYYVLANLHLVNGYGLLTEDGTKQQNNATD